MRSLETLAVISVGTVFLMASCSSDQPASTSEVVGDEPSAAVECGAGVSECVEPGDSTLTLDLRRDLIGNIGVLEDRILIDPVEGRRSSDMMSLFQVGKIVTGGPLFAQDAFMRRVVSIAPDGDRIAIQTEHAGLNEAVRATRIRQTWQMSFDEDGALIPKRMVPGAAQAALSFGSDSWNCEEVFFGESGGDNYAAVEPCELTFGPQITLEIDVDDFQLTHFKFVVGFQTSLEFDGLVRAAQKREGDDSWSIERRLYDETLKKLTFWIGPIPVRINLELLINLGMTGTFGSAGELGFGLEAGLAPEIGVEYTSDDGWEVIFEANPTNDFHAPTFDIDDNAGASFWLRPEIRALLYGVAGPSIWARPWVSVEAERACEVRSGAGTVTNELGWVANWGIEGGASVDLEIGSLDIGRDFGSFDILEPNELATDTEVLGVRNGTCCDDQDCNSACVIGATCESYECVGGRARSDCCETVADCPTPEDERFSYSCNDNVCVLSVENEGCSGDADCSDGNPCTTDTCVNNACNNTNDNGCIRCASDEDCTDGNICTVDTCGVNGRCNYAANTEREQCCATASDCEEEGDCYSVVCNTDFVCKRVLLHEPGCCTTSEQCGSTGSCMDTYCDEATSSCETLPFNECVSTDLSYMHL